MTTLPKLLIANRGEIAVRIANAAFNLDIPTVSLFTQDDPHPLHRSRTDHSVELPGRGVAAWLDGGAIIKIAQEHGCTLIHPGYGFLSENGQFARDCHTADITFIGPDPDDLDLLGNKIQARHLAADMGVPIVPGTRRPTTLEEALAFLESGNGQNGIMLKALAGGGGRGMRQVRASTGSADELTQAELVEAFTRATSEAKRAFGNGELYVEKLIVGGRHIEVQIIG
ncbi:MAG: pyruvate carboxylase, partial [Cellvibrionaceae bacterium]